jgi:drug/metabolite transporter (DMT)-like permease
VNLQDALYLLPLLACVFVIVGVIVVSRHPDRPYAVPLARAVLLTGAAFMLCLGWWVYDRGPDHSPGDWLVMGLGLACGVTFGGAALFGRGEKVLWWIQQVRNGF